jgi:acyl-CoA dehydrogenase
MKAHEHFRETVRGWLEENCPASMRTPMASDDDICWGGRKFAFQSEEQRVWLGEEVRRRRPGSRGM